MSTPCHRLLLPDLMSKSYTNSSLSLNSCLAFHVHPVRHSQLCPLSEMLVNQVLDELGLSLGEEVNN